MSTKAKRGSSQRKDDRGASGAKEPSEKTHEHARAAAAERRASRQGKDAASSDTHRSATEQQPCTQAMKNTHYVATIRKNCVQVHTRGEASGQRSMRGDVYSHCLAQVSQGTAGKCGLSAGRSSAATTSDAEILKTPRHCAQDL